MIETLYLQSKKENKFWDHAPAKVFLYCYYTSLSSELHFYLTATLMVPAGTQGVHLCGI